MALYYQLNNDYCNLYSDKNTNDDSYCSDITEGNFIFPIVHALTINPNDRKIINILNKRTKNVEIKLYCIKLLESVGSFKYTRDVLEKLDKKMRIEIERLGGNPLLVESLNNFKSEIPKTHLKQDP